MSGSFYRRIRRSTIEQLHNPFLIELKMRKQIHNGDYQQVEAAYRESITYCIDSSTTYINLVVLYEYCLNNRHMALAQLSKAGKIEFLLTKGGVREWGRSKDKLNEFHINH